MNSRNDTTDRLQAERIRSWRKDWKPQPSPWTLAIWSLFVLLFVIVPAILMLKGM